MNEQVRILAHLRQTEGNAKETLARIEADLAASPLGQKLARAKELLAATCTDRDGVEKALRVSALAQYSEDGNKKPHPAVGIVLCTTLDYDQADALEYARQHLPKALKLNKRVFEKAAKAIEPNFVTIGQEPRVRIASDLSLYLGKEERNRD